MALNLNSPYQIKCPVHNQPFLLLLLLLLILLFVAYACFIFNPITREKPTHQHHSSFSFFLSKLFCFFLFCWQKKHKERQREKEREKEREEKRKRYSKWEYLVTKNKTISSKGKYLLTHIYQVATVTNYDQWYHYLSLTSSPPLFPLTYSLFALPILSKLVIFCFLNWHCI